MRYKMTDIIMLEYDSGMRPAIVIFDELIDINEFGEKFDKAVLEEIDKIDFDYDDLYNWIYNNYKVKQFIFTDNITHRVMV